MTFTPPVLPRRPRTDYIDPPARIRDIGRRRTSAGKRGWYAGWPDHCPTSSARAVLPVTRPQDGKLFLIDVDDRLAELFNEWLVTCQELAYPLIGALEVNSAGGKQGGVGSFACRAIKGSSPPAPSNHSSATALDLYTRSNPQRWSESGRVTFWSTIHPIMVELAGAADLYWGGWYWDISKGTYMDAMHFEYMLRPQDVPTSLNNLRLKAAEIRRRLQPVPTPEDPVDTEQVKQLQRTLNRLGAAPQLVVDGDYGAQTEAALEALPTRIEGQLEAVADSVRAETKNEAVAAVSSI